MAEATNKVVNIIAPAGVKINWQGITGYSEKVVVPTTIIKRLLAQGCKVEEVKEDETTVELTEDNYESDNGGMDPETIDYDATVDYVELLKEERKAQHEARLKEIGEAYKKLFEEMEKAEEEKDEEIAGTEVDVPTEPETKAVKEVTTATPYVEPSPANQPPTMNNKKKFFNKKKNSNIQTEVINEAKV